MLTVASPVVIVLSIFTVSPLAPVAPPMLIAGAVHPAIVQKWDKMYLPRLFQNDPTLNSLRLIYQRISDAIATRLSEALSVNSTLTSLILSDNEIDDQGINQFDSKGDR